MKKPLMAASACLCGICCKYNGGSNTQPLLKALFEEGLVLPICPESTSGLKAPRLPSEQRGSFVVDRDGMDLTAYFAKGAALTLQRVREKGLTIAVMKERSPSCGVHAVYDGSFGGVVVPGMGTASAALHGAGIRLMSEEEFAEAFHSREQVLDFLKAQI